MEQLSRSVNSTAFSDVNALNYKTIGQNVALMLDKHTISESYDMYSTFFDGEEELWNS